MHRRGARHLLEGRSLLVGSDFAVSCLRDTAFDRIMGLRRREGVLEAIRSVHQIDLGIIVYILRVHLLLLKLLLVL